MNDLLVTLGIASWKPVIGALLLPPTPFVLLVLVGGALMRRSRGLAWALLLAGALGTWFMCTPVAATALTRLLLSPPPALGAGQIAGLKNAPKTAIVVLGGGHKLAPEYGLSDLTHFGIERLRYGLWLSRQTSLPVAFSGGLGHGSRPGPTEAEIAARVAASEFGQPLRWTESASRDTNENAVRSLPLMRTQGIEHIVLVTHGFHMRRALAAFERAAQGAPTPMKLTPASMGLDAPARGDLHDWLPSRAGFDKVNIALHEWLGRLAGA